MVGCLDVLNCGAGHLKVAFDKTNAMDVDRARRMIADMLKRGYALFVEEPDGSVRRVAKFDPKTDEYILSDVPAPKVKEPEHGETVRRHAYRPAKTRRPLRTTRVTGVGRTAGG